MDIDPALGFNPVGYIFFVIRIYITVHPRYQINFFLQSCNNTFAIEIMAIFERALSVYRYVD